MSTPIRTVLFGLAGMAALAAAGCGGGDSGTDPGAYPDPDPLVLDTTGLLPLPETPDNPLTVQGVELGRKLFHDPILSGDDTQSCASCHDQAFAFSDHGLQFSIGIDGSVGTRNAPPVINLAWARDFFWAGRAKTLEDQAVQPVPNPIEMNLPWDQAIPKLAAHPDYPAMFG
ncbi:MAG TPA: cytochrome-c peroxidase, partial [bacterium]|nr:cytochrome-c peroxidase [bacterium]